MKYYEIMNNSIQIPIIISLVVKSVQSLVESPLNIAEHHHGPWMVMDGHGRGTLRIRSTFSGDGLLGYSPWAGGKNHGNSQWGDFLVMFYGPTKIVFFVFFRDFMPHFDVKVFFSCRLCGK
jgi:hypothetical protein